MRVQLLRIGPQLLSKYARSTHRFQTQLQAEGSSLLTHYQEQIAVYTASLESLSPLSVLSRGYAALFDNSKHVITSVSQISLHQNINVRLADGSILCNPIEVTHEPLYDSKGE